MLNVVRATLKAVAVFQEDAMAPPLNAEPADTNAPTGDRPDDRLADGPRPTVLRLTLALKGGVSLAVWMGGACSEIVELLRGRDGPYAEAIAEAGYDAVEVDVISGSSAGGLNGVLLAQHIAYGAAFNHTVRDLWLETGDLGRLARSPFTEPPLSLLRGDHAFYPRLAEAMGDLARSAQPHAVRLLVTTTRLRSRLEQTRPDVGDALLTNANAAVFRFVSRAAPPDLSLFADGSAPPAPTHLITPDAWSRDRLAYAARCTSSFPGAFEPGRIDVCAEVGPVTASAGPPHESYVPMRGASSETGWPDDLLGAVTTPRRLVEVVDGGVLDNVPIGWALRSIASMPADRPVDRWLVYLDPSPTSQRPVDETRVRPIVMLQLIRKALRVKSNVESLADDVREHARLAQTVESHRVSTEAALAAAERSDLHAVAAAGFAEYAENMRRAELARLRQLFTDPAAVLVADPLPFVPARNRGVALDDGLPAGAVSPEVDDLRRLGAESRTPFVAARSLTLLLGLIRRAERQGTGRDLKEPRVLFYNVRTLIEAVIGIRDRAMLAAAASAVPEPDPEASASDLGVTPAAIYAEGTRITSRHLARVAASLRPEYADPGYWITLAHAVADTPVDDGPGAAADPPYELLWRGVTLASERLARVLPGTPSPDELSLVEILTGPMRPDPLASPALPRLAVLSAAARSPLEEELLGRGITAQNRVALKLSGNELSNFGGFLSARWRHNDWIWGRLDGAQTVLDILGRCAPVVPPDGSGAVPGSVSGSTPCTTTHSDAIARRQDAILEEELATLVATDTPPGAAGQDTIDARGHRRELGVIGAESVLALLSRRPLRRTVIHLGLNLLAGLTTRRPDDQGAPALARGGSPWREPIALPARLILGPVVAVPVILAIASPATSLSAAALIWAALAYGTGHWATLTHLGLVLGMAFAASGAALRLMAGRVSRAVRRGQAPALFRPVAAAAGLTLVLGSLGWGLAHLAPPAPYDPIRAAGCGCAAFMVTQGRTLLAAEDRATTAVMFVLTATAVFITTWAAAHQDWFGRGPLMVYLGLLATLVGLAGWIIRTAAPPRRHVFGTDRVASAAAPQRHGEP